MGEVIVRVETMSAHFGLISSQWRIYYKSSGPDWGNNVATVFVLIPANYLLLLRHDSVVCSQQDY